MSLKNNFPSFYTGSVIKIFYFTTLNKFRRIFTFIGLCTNFNLKKKSFTLKNFYRKEYLTLSFLITSPNIIAIDLLRSYNFDYNKSKLSCLKKLNLTAKTDILSEKIIHYKKNVVPYLFRIKGNKPIEKKRLRSKFRL